jgi:S-disulfanyl-L-cysteine oxidoreductase SoxD
MTSRLVMGVTVIMIAGGLCGSALRAAAQGSGSSVTSGVYTADQAKRGQATYTESCSKCHLEDLSGGKDSPPLVGNEFLSGWKGKTVGALFEEVRMTMPFDAPGSLKPEQYIDVIAYLFSANKFPAGDKELAKESSALELIKFEP